MLRKFTIAGSAIGAALGLPLLALFHLGHRVLALPFPPYDLFEMVARALPGPLLNAVLEVMIGTLQALRLGSTSVLGKLVEAGLAWALMLALVTSVGASLAWALQRSSGTSKSHAIAGGAALWAFLLPAGLWADWGMAAFAWSLALCAGWGLAFGWALEQWVALETTPIDPRRREALTRLGLGALTFTALGIGLGRLFRPREPRAASLPSGPDAGSASAGDFLPLPGTRAELTPVGDFYRVDIKLIPPKLDASDWKLEVSGLVERPLQLSYDELSALPSEAFYATLECISNRVGGDLISTTRFTGVSLIELLNRAGLRPEAVDIKFTCADGYTESLTVESALDPETRLCFAMDGAPLTPEHGFPTRLWTPNRYGMKNPKWITKIEAVGDDYLGFWEQRGWTDAAWVKTTSVIDATQWAGEGLLDVGGIAYAGARGIGKVEVRVDDGEWTGALLKAPLSGWTWVLWRARVKAARGVLRLTVRATNGEGQLQTERVADVFPDGASGYYEVLMNSG